MFPPPGNTLPDINTGHFQSTYLSPWLPPSDLKREGWRGLGEEGDQRTRQTASGAQIDPIGRPRVTPRCHSNYRDRSERAREMQEGGEAWQRSVRYRCAIYRSGMGKHKEMRRPSLKSFFKAAPLDICSFLQAIFSRNPSSSPSVPPLHLLRAPLLSRAGICL